MTADDGLCIPEFDLEFPETFQIHINNMFPGSCSFLNTTAARSFYADLLDFAPQKLIDKKSVEQLLHAYSPGWADGGVLSSVPCSMLMPIG